MVVKVRCYELPEGPLWLHSLPLSSAQHRAAVFQPRAWQIVHCSTCSWGHPTAPPAVFWFLLRIITSPFPRSLPGVVPKTPEAMDCRALPQGFRTSAERSELLEVNYFAASPESNYARKTPSFPVLPEAFLLLPSSPGLADGAAGQLHLAPPKVDAPGPPVLLSELFPGQRFFLQKQSPTCNC